MKLQVTFDQVLQINNGNFNQTKELIDNFIYSKDLIPIRNRNFQGYISNSLSLNDLSFKKEKISSINIFKSFKKYLSIFVQIGDLVLRLFSFLNFR
ncbi:hypothetical protein SAMN06295967_111131 [Belliella buryatensis]|uniref:Uncharacterized protein n=1 Tax=Belliella buryatensis TaxID=1500549 RepID=A0A239F5B3_9BACT|nr:hypothetical protein SAMN06295967_111131 [Belliella buryatensis]